jgi:hypothetical protein
VDFSDFDSRSSKDNDESSLRRISNRRLLNVQPDDYVLWEFDMKKTKTFYVGRVLKDKNVEERHAH